MKVRLLKGVVLAVSVSVLLASCSSGDRRAVAASPSATQPSSPSSSLSPSPSAGATLPLSALVDASRGWKKALRSYLVFKSLPLRRNPSAAQVLQIADQAESLLANAEEAFDIWWSLAEPAVASTQTREEVAAYAKHARAWMDVQHQLIDFLGACSGQGAGCSGMSKSEFEAFQAQDLKLTDYVRKNGWIIQIMILAALPQA